MEGSSEGSGGTQLEDAESSQWAARLGANRIEALTDGVFAIAMTILVLELSVPNLVGSHEIEEGPTSFGGMWEEFYVYVIGFLVLGIYWILHKYMFHFIRRSDGVLVWLNILFLLMAALVTFSTKVITFNQGLVSNERTDANLFFEVTTISTILLLLVMWLYATHGRRLVDEDIDVRIVSTLKRIIIGVSIMLISIIIGSLSPVLGMTLAFVSMVFMIGTTAYGRYLPGLGK